MAPRYDLRAQLRAHGSAVALGAVLLTACLVFGGLGIAARRRLTVLRAQQQQVAAAIHEVDAFESAFRRGSADDTLRMQLPESLEVAVPRDRRVGVAEHVATLAEAAGLTNVRVWFEQGGDSAAAPTKPDLVSAPVEIANYTLAVECDGSYAALLALIRELPPSLAFQRLIASGTAASKPQFRLTLDVFDAEPAATIDNAAGHG